MIVSLSLTVLRDAKLFRPDLNTASQHEFEEPILF
jgi:hypothetical protein